jgi:hypothetical protein
MFTDVGGWPFGTVRDSDAAIYEKEKQIGGPNPVRLSNILVVELAKAQQVTSFNVALPHVCQFYTFFCFKVKPPSCAVLIGFVVLDGTGSGPWSKLSSSIPNFVRTSIAQKQVYRFDVEGVSPQLPTITTTTPLFQTASLHIR